MRRHLTEYHFDGVRFERTGLIRAREALGLDRAAFAELLGVNRVFVYKVETGRQDPSLWMMQKWVAALGPAGSLDLFWTPAEIPSYKIVA